MNNNIYANEFEARDYILKKGENCNSIEDLCALIKEVENNFHVDYETTPKAIGAVCSTIADYLSNKLGLTGYQYNVVMWTFICSYMYGNIRTGIELVNYDKMLCPDTEEKFNKYISSNTWKNLQKEAQKNLDNYKNNKLVHPSLEYVKHWQSIIDGQVPFGYKVKD